MKNINKIILLGLGLILILVAANSIFVDNKYIIKNIEVRVVDSIGNDGCLILNPYSPTNITKTSALAIYFDKEYVTDYSKTIFSNRKHSFGGDGPYKGIKSLTLKINDTILSNNIAIDSFIIVHNNKFVNYDILINEGDECFKTNNFKSINSFIEIFNSSKLIGERDLTSEIYFFFQREKLSKTVNSILMEITFEDNVKINRTISLSK